MSDLPVDALTRTIDQLRKTVHRVISSEMETLQVSSVDARYLSQLYLQPEGMTLRQLSEHLQVDKAHTTRVVHHLEALGYVCKDTQNKRKYKVALTAQGRLKAKQVHALLLQSQQTSLEGLSDEQIGRLLEILTAITNNLKQMLPTNPEKGK